MMRTPREPRTTAWGTRASSQGEVAGFGTHPRFPSKFLTRM